MKLTRSNGKIVVRDNDFKNAIKSLPIFGIGVSWLVLGINRLLYVENSSILLNIVGILFSAAFSIVGGRLLQIQFARLITLDVPGKVISVQTFRFLRKKTHEYRFDKIDRFEVSPCGTDEVCFDLKLKDGETLEIGSKSVSSLTDLKYIAEVLNNELRK